MVDKGGADRSIRRVLAFYKLARVVEQPLLFDRTFEEYMLHALDPERIIQRYRRVWRISKPQQRDGFIIGKLGFLYPTIEARLAYDERRHDFIPREEFSEDVSFSHFVIDVHESLLAFELKPPQIRPQSFIGAMQALLREGGAPYKVLAIPDPQSFDDWRANVERITELSITAVVPNPRSNRSKDLVKRLKSMNATRVAIRAFSEKNDGLDLSDDLLASAIGHVTSGYGAEKARAISKSGRIVRFDSQSHVKTVEIEGKAGDSSEEVVTTIIKVTRREKRSG